MASALAVSSGIFIAVSQALEQLVAASEAQRERDPLDGRHLAELLQIGAVRRVGAGARARRINPRPGLFRVAVALAHAAIIALCGSRTRRWRWRRRARACRRACSRASRRRRAPW